jgi:hypothetical protein
MKRAVLGSAAAGATVLGVIVVRQRRRRPVRRPDRWHSVTINRPPEEVGSLPEPLAGLGSAIEVRVRPAPGDRGTEVAARLRDGQTGRTDEDLRRLRFALLEARQLAEIGELLLPDKPPTTKRTLRNRPLEYATRHGREDTRI